MNSTLFLVVNLALAFYNVGTIWAHEIDIFRSWKLLDAPTFHRVQAAHWHKLPYWVLGPAALALVGSFTLVWWYPLGSPAWAIWCGVACQVAAHILTVVVWGRWQAKLSQDPLGSASPYLARILSTHWIRTILVSAYGLALLIWAIEVLGMPMKPAARADQLLAPGARDESPNQSFDQWAPCWLRYTKELSSKSTKENRDEQVSSELWVDLSADAPEALFCDNVSYQLDESDQQGR
jgi:hypothetical protein